MFLIALFAGEPRTWSPRAPGVNDVRESIARAAAEARRAMVQAGDRYDIIFSYC